MGFGKQSDSFQEIGVSKNILVFGSICFFLSPPLLIRRDCGASQPANSRLEAGYYTLCEPDIQKAIIFQRKAFHSNNVVCYFEARRTTFPSMAPGRFNWMVINKTDLGGGHCWSCWCRLQLMLIWSHWKWLTWPPVAFPHSTTRGGPL